MHIVRTAIAALVLALASAAPAQGPAPVVPSQVNQTAPAPTGEATAPGPSAQTTGAAASNAAPAFPMSAPQAGIGQPVPAGIELQKQVTPNGERALWMHNAILMPLITVISLFVLALLLWTMLRYSRRANPVPSKTSHNTLIEVVWTLVPVLILVAIAIPSISLLAAQYRPASKDALTIKAIGNQWYWTYEYPDNGGFEIVANMLSDADAAKRGEPRLLGVDNRIFVPVGREVRLLTTSNDVIHSWAVPAFWTKMDAVPGRVNETTFTVDRPGVYYGQCSELCGARHAFMPIAVEAVSEADFARWVASKGGTMPGAKPAAAALAATPGQGALQAPKPSDAGLTAAHSAPETPSPGTSTATAPKNAAQTNDGPR